jgi:RNA polymerase sigma-70 factor (ECF subfamily)
MDLRCERTFERVYAEHSPAMRAVAARVVKDPALAHDVTQDVFLRLWSDPSCFDPSRGSLGVLLRRMAHNRAVDLQRRAGTGARAADRLTAEAERLDAPLGRSPAEHVERSMTAREVRAAVRRLPAAQREVLGLAYWADVPIARVADVTGIPLGTAKSRVRLGLQRLRGEIAAAA